MSITQIASLFAVDPNVVTAVLITALLAMIIIVVACSISFRNGRTAERRAIFDTADVLIFTQVGAMRVGGGLMHAQQGLAYITPKDRRRRANTLEFATRWARRLLGGQVMLWPAQPDPDQTSGHELYVIERRPDVDDDKQVPLPHGDG